MTKIAHIIPTLEIGGAEIAAINIAKLANETEYMIFPIRKIDMSLLNSSDIIHKVIFPRKILFSYNIGLLYNLIKYKPNIIISSLWKSSFISFLYCKLFKCKFYYFLHSSRFFNVFDSIFSRLAFRFSEATLVDSKSAYEFYKSKYKEKKAFPFYLLLRKLNRFSKNIISENFVFIGRVTRIKNIKLSIDLFNEIIKYHPHAKFDIYGPTPDKNYLDELNRYISELNLDNYIKFKGIIEYKKIPFILSSYDYYLQTSSAEGMAISVVEAMQIGLIPIVTCVGEIKYYCTDLVNSIIVNEKYSCCEKILHVLNDQHLSKLLSINASKSFEDYKTISESLKKLINYEKK